MNDEQMGHYRCIGQPAAVRPQHRQPREALVNGKIGDKMAPLRQGTAAKDRVVPRILQAQPRTRFPEPLLRATNVVQRPQARRRVEPAPPTGGTGQDLLLGRAPGGPDAG